MSEDPYKKKDSYRSRLAPLIGKKEARKLRARREGRNNPVQAVALFGLVGWSVALPTLLSLALGIWIDRTWPGQFSWTLMLLLIGIILGCYNAWRVIQKELFFITPDTPDQKEGQHDANDQQ
jgi:ATP synthase protein I